MTDRVSQDSRVPSVSTETALSNSGGKRWTRSVQSADLTLLREQARADRLFEQRVHPVGERSELALVESAEDAAGVDDGGVPKHGLQVEDDTAGNQASMDSLQGVHDAFKGQSSQRVRKESDVEAGQRLIEFEGAYDLEADTLG